MSIGRTTAKPKIAKWGEICSEVALGFFMNLPFLQMSFFNFHDIVTGFFQEKFRVFKVATGAVHAQAR